MFYLQNSSACLCLVLSLLTSSRPTLCGITRYRPIQRSCGVEEPSTGLQDTHRWLHENEVLDNDLWNSTNMPQGHGHTASDRQQQQPHHRRQTLTPLYTIDTYFHIIADSSSAPTSSTSYISDSMIAAQFRYLAQAYTGAAIGFRLAGIDRSTNDTWASNGDDLGMKRTLRRGSYASLNIYYQSELQSAPGTPGVPAGSTLLGYCSLPAAGITVASPRDAYVLDGCNVLSGTMPGGSVGAYNLGGTTAHEVGHWNGLLHTFTGNSCDAGDFGDYVADTPQEMTSTGEFALSSLPHHHSLFLYASIS